MRGDRVPTPLCRTQARMLPARGSAAQLQGRCRRRVRGHGCEIKARPPAQLLFLNSKQAGGGGFFVFWICFTYYFYYYYYFTVILDGISLCTPNWLDMDDAVWVGPKSAEVLLPQPPKCQDCRGNHAQPSFNFNICPLKKKPNSTKGHKWKSLCPHVILNLQKIFYKQSLLLNRNIYSHKGACIFFIVGNHKNYSEPSLLSSQLLPSIFSNQFI